MARAGAAARNGQPRQVQAATTRFESPEERLARWNEQFDYAPPSPAGLGGRPAVADRRTVRISGRGAEGYATRHGTRPSSAQRHRNVKPHERAGFKPDRIAMWAIVLGVMLTLAAAASSHAAVLAHVLH